MAASSSAACAAAARAFAELRASGVITLSMIDERPVAVVHDRVDLVRGLGGVPGPWSDDPPCRRSRIWSVVAGGCQIQTVEVAS